MKPSRISREVKTIRALLMLYCKHHHGKQMDILCSKCKELEEYVVKRLYACPFQNEKPTCANCLVHCYNRDMRGKVQRIMRYSGPRLTVRHPILAICHILDGRIKPQPLKTKTVTTQTGKDYTDGYSL